TQDMRPLVVSPLPQPVFRLPRIGCCIGTVRENLQRSLIIIVGNDTRNANRASRLSAHRRFLRGDARPRPLGAARSIPSLGRPYSLLSVFCSSLNNCLSGTS